MRVNVRQFISLDTALRYFNGTLRREGVLEEVEAKRYYKKPSQRRREKDLASKFRFRILKRSERGETR